jgi:hypothetical protein
MVYNTTIWQVIIIPMKIYYFRYNIFYYESDPLIKISNVIDLLLSSYLFFKFFTF